MMFIESIAKEFLPDISRQHLSTACLCTSNPVYLIFTDRQTYPEIAIRLSESEKIVQDHNVLAELYNYTGDLVPQPLVHLRHGNRFISVQKGVDGMPWFQLAGNINNKAQWDKLRAKAIETLTRLHQGIQLNNKWIKSCQPGEELRQRYEQTSNSDIVLPENTGSFVTRLANELDQLGSIQVFPQHGDFCLNNLIIEEDKMHVIDIEDFGMTCMPLHDQFTLALSTYQLAPDIAHSSLSENIDQCIHNSLHQLQLDKQYVSGFFMYHLLLRLGEWSQNRLPYRQWLMTILEEFTSDPDLLTNKI